MMVCVPRFESEVISSVYSVYVVTEILQSQCSMV